MLLSPFHWLLLLVPTRSISSAPLLSVCSTMDAAMDAAFTFSLTTTSCPHKVNKFCTSVVCLFNNGCCDGCCYHLFIDYYFLSPTRSISPAPLLSVYSTMDAAVTFSLTTTSCSHKINKFCTSIVCLFNSGCCYYLFIDYYFLSPEGQWVLHLYCLSIQ